PNPRVAEEIIKRCIKICPELTSGKGAESLEIKRHAVGLRPARKGNIRLELKIIPKDELPPNTGFGMSYTTVTIDVDKYLPWLLNQFVDAGGKYEKRHLANINEAMEDD
ncbi:3983_t:CDS:2, partial [Entrophospora sp. SA101]